MTYVGRSETSAVLSTASSAGGAACRARAFGIAHAVHEPSGVVLCGADVTDLTVPAGRWGDDDLTLPCADCSTLVALATDLEIGDHP